MMDNNENISFLLGAGFSIPAGFPSARGLNRRIIDWGYQHTRQIRSEGIIPSIHENYLLLGAIQFYIQEAIGSCNYEDFLDFLYDLPAQDRFPEFLQGYFDQQDIQRRVDTEYIEMYYLNATVKYQDWVRHAIGWPDAIEGRLDSYDPFCRIIRAFPPGKIINIHSTNHDLLIEYLSDHGLLGQPYSDGFCSDAVLKVRYKDHKGHSVVCPRYTGTYDGNLRLYKLHGSLHYYYFHKMKKGGQIFRQDVIKGHLGIDESSFYEVNDQEEVIGRDPFNYIPIFLTGRKNKDREYQNEFFFKPTFAQFIENLRQASLLIAIGFSFNDEKLVSMIKEHLPSGVKCIIVDPSPSEEMQKFARERRNTEILRKGVQELVPKDII